MKPFFVSTPIYYVNDKPHIGHAYSTIAADVFSRFARLRGRPTFFLTGLDEHGLKIERRAEEEGLSPQAFTDRMAPPFREAWELLRCRHDDFIRTTEKRHEQLASALFERLASTGDIYLGDYEDWYCVGCESFKTEKELLPGNICPDHKKPVERIKEQSYFFRLSAYGDRLLAFYEANPTFVQPEGRFNEVKAFVREGLRDLSVSRTSFKWGIPVPGAPHHVMYVWLDALANYLSALGGPSAPGTSELYDRFWAGDAERVHIVGKDILRFHAIFWPAFLLSADLPLPSRIEAHGWLTVNGEKMSKSLGNFLPPGPLVDAFGADVLRYYLMREVGFGQDGDFSHENLIARYNGELANGLGNLQNRILSSFVRTTFDGRVPHADRTLVGDAERDLAAVAERVAIEAAQHLAGGAPHRALDAIFELVGAANKYVDASAPWALAKKGETARLAVVCYFVLECLRWLSILLAPFMPERSDALRAQLGLAPLLPVEGVDQWPSVFGVLAAGTATRADKPLFPRFEKDQEQAVLERLGVRKPAAPAAEKPSKKAPRAAPEAVAAPAPTPGAASPAPAEPVAGTIGIDDVMKVHLRLALIVSASRVPKSDKLLALQCDLGEGAPRQILAGIGLHYAPEDLVGKRIVVVANLAPRKMMGLESQGMVLAASDADALSVLFVEKAITPGSAVK